MKYVLLDIPEPLHQLMLQAVCCYFDIQSLDILSAKKTSERSYYRGLLFFLIKEDMQLQVSTIGQIFKIPRNTIIASIGRIESQKDVYRQVNVDLKNIRTIFATLQLEHQSMQAIRLEGDKKKVKKWIDNSDYTQISLFK